ncbi:hypothetical protein [Methylobacterium nigriterrae]|uniref:hypothetical protein n=1 Tax=Methylobacterium nigriterrae TaxID=3127512 RepID=UPI0030131FED
MADPRLICEVRVQGGDTQNSTGGHGQATGPTAGYRDWLTVSISQDYEEFWPIRFRLVCAEPDPKVFRLKPGDRVDITLAGEEALIGGYIIARQTAYDGSRHAVEVSGYGKAELITRASIDTKTQNGQPGGQYRGYTLSAIANAVLKPYSMKFQLQDPPEGADEPFPNVVVRTGESPFELIARLANQRAVRLSAGKDGTIIGTGASKSGSLIRFVEGQNILAARCSMSDPGVSEVIANAQRPGSDQEFGRKAAEVKAKGSADGGPSTSTRIIMAEMPLSPKEAALRADMEVQQIAATQLRVSVTYAGWLRPGIGGLWDLQKDWVIVRSPMLFPNKGGELELKLWGYSYQQDAQGGSQTTVDLVNEMAFSARYRSANDTSQLPNMGITPAQPENAS